MTLVAMLRVHDHNVVLLSLSFIPSFILILPALHNQSFPNGTIIFRVIIQCLAQSVH